EERPAASSVGGTARGAARNGAELSRFLRGYHGARLDRAASLAAGLAIAVRAMRLRSGLSLSAGEGSAPPGRFGRDGLRRPVGTGGNGVSSFLDRTWTDAQRRAIDLEGRDILVTAGAGTGKTSVLVARIL